jgi:PAS domain S-box-containing protein
MAFRFRGLSSRIYVTFLIAAVLPVMIAGMIGVYFSIKALRSETLKHLDQEVISRADSIARFIEQLSSEVSYLAGSSVLRELADMTADQAGALPAGARQKMERDFGTFARAYPYIYQIRFLDTRGTEVVRVDRYGDGLVVVPPDRLQDKSDRYYFRDAMALDPGRIYVSPLDLNIERGQVEKPEQPVIRVGTPVRDGAGRKGGLLIINLHAELFLRQIQQLADAHGGTAYLFDRAGFYLARSAVDNTLPSFDMRPVSHLNQLLPALLLKPILEGKRGSIEVGEWIVAHGPVSLEAMPERPRSAFREWALAVQYPQSRFFETVFNLYLLYAVLVLCLAVTAIAGFLLSRRLLRPLELLREETAEIAKGNLSRRVEVRGTDEIADLGTSMNLMAERLETSYRELQDRKDFLEEQVALRTADLERERRSLSAIIQNTEDAIMTVDSGGAVALANPAAKKIFENDIRPLIGKRLEEIWPEWPSSATGEQEAGQSPRRIECSKGNRLLSVAVSVIRDSAAGRARILVARDVTEERRLVDTRRELDRQMFQLEKMTTMGELAMGLAHEIGNPLAGMKTVVQSLMEEETAPATRKSLTRIEGEVDRLSAFLHTFHGFAAPQETHPVPVRLQDVLEDVLLWTRKEARSKGIQIRYRHDDGAIPPLWADPNHLKQVLLNLVINAVHAIERDGAIVISSCAMPDEPGSPARRARVCVEDDGAGIAPEILPRIFEPFFTTRSDGTGLGLAVVKKIAALHGADIHVHSRSGGGTRFELAWPVASPGDPPLVRTAAPVASVTWDNAI